MKDQQKYISAIVILVSSIYIVGNWVKSILGDTIASFITSVGTVSLLIYGLFWVWDKFGWKNGKISRLLCYLVGFYEYPVIEGKWKVDYESTYGSGKKGSGEAVIKQSYSELCIDGSFGTSSTFESFFAQLKQNENGKWFFVYAYVSKPQDKKLLNSLSGGMHEGFVYLDVISKNELRGYYSNDENRKTRGTLVFTRKSK